jgi:hypothetical protein
MATVDLTGKGLRVIEQTAWHLLCEDISHGEPGTGFIILRGEEDGTGEAMLIVKELKK